jgi:EAL domain-containing protein (putative c-di-GMP-specific phosphodiesterase class I)
MSREDRKKSYPSIEPSGTRYTGRVLLAEDDPAICRGYARLLQSTGHTVEVAFDGQQAVDLIRTHEYDVILSDIAMPGMDGLQLLRAIRERDLDVPVILMTGGPTLESAVRAVEYGALRYLTKPIETDSLRQVVEQAVKLSQMARVKRAALELHGAEVLPGDLAGLQASFERALGSLWIAYQPIVRWSDRRVFGYEALVRTRDATLSSPTSLIAAAERLGRITRLGQAIRDVVPAPMNSAPTDVMLFVNLHTRDLNDDTLVAPESPLARIADRVVLEITERARLDQVKDLRARVAELRRLGFRIAVDDLGAGYAGLNSFAQLEPDVVKLDMSLVRHVDREITKRKVIHSMASLCRDMGMLVVCEGVESAEEREALLDLECDLFQGYLFAPPGPAFPSVRW